MVILLQLSKPLNAGQTMHHFIMIQIDNNAGEAIKINLTPEEMRKRYQGEVSETEPLYLVLAKMLRLVAGIDRIVIPGDFKSGQDDKS